MNRSADKPRLWFYKGLWHCSSQRLECLRMGLGYTPEEAFRDWEAM